MKPHLTLKRALGMATLAVIALAAVAFLPTLFRSETALQVRASRQGTTVPDGFFVYQQLNAAGIHIKSITPDHNSLVIKFDSQEQSTAAEKVLRRVLPEGFDIAHLDQASEWVSRIGSRKQSIG